MKMAVCLSFLLLCCLFGWVIYFRQSSATEGLPLEPPNPAASASAGTRASTASAGAGPREVSVAPPAIHLPSYTDTFADSMDRDFYQTIIRNNLFAPLGTDVNAEPEPGAHLSLVGTFVSEDPSASSVLVKDATTGRHHRLSVGEGVGDFHLLAIEAKQVRFYHHGTEVKLVLPENLFLNPTRR